MRAYRTIVHTILWALGRFSSDESKREGRHGRSSTATRVSHPRVSLTRPPMSGRHNSAVGRHHHPFSDGRAFYSLAERAERRKTFSKHSRCCNVYTILASAVRSPIEQAALIGTNDVFQAQMLFARSSSFLFRLTGWATLNSTCFCVCWTCGPDRTSFNIVSKFVLSGAVQMQDVR